MDHDFDEDERTQEPHAGDERRAQVLGALLKVLVVVGVIAVVIAVGTVIAVRSLGLDEPRDQAGSTTPAPSALAEPLPTTALPVPGQDPDAAEPSDSASASPGATPAPKGRKKGIRLEASPPDARPGEQINLTGTYPATDSGVLLVQRLQDGTWADFGVDATVRGNSYATYVITQRTGEQRFRMYDPETQRSSNVVRVNVG
jgi:hypothetical protein